MTSWRREYLTALENRDKHEKANVEIYNAYTKLADGITPRRGIQYGQSTPDTKDTRTPDISWGQAEPNPNARSRSSAFSEPLAGIRHDLIEAQRSKGALQAQSKAVTDELEKLKIRSKVESKRLNELAAERTVLTTRLRDRDEELKGKAKLLEDVQDEMISLHLQLNMAEERSRKLQRENKDLVDRWMARMGQEADAMNDASTFS
ncbi:MAG: hypothetical protein M1830_002294 [Pleopsidium flavum]|nr:MAG: hypothetical protein M1830_002294 [Pleopsidium flavum]